MDSFELIRDLIELHPTADVALYKPIYHASWRDYEEWGSVFILEIEDGRLFSQRDGYSVYAASSDEGVAWSPFPISMDEALEIMMEWDGIEQNQAMI